MLDLDLLPGEHAVCRLPAGSALPASLSTGPEALETITAAGHRIAG